MSKHARDTDKTFSKLAYRFSSSLCPLDLVIKHLYEEALLSTRLLTLDTLSSLNEIRRDKALKSFISNHQPSSENETVFGTELQNIIEKENREAKIQAWKHLQGRSSDRSPKPTINIKVARRDLRKAYPSQYTTRSFKVVRPESDMRIPYQQTLFHVEYFFSPEKSWCSQISNRFTRTKQLYSLYAFQNRRLGPRKSINTAQRLYDIDRYQRGLSPCTITSRSPKIFRVQMQRKVLLLHMSSLWAVNQPTNIYKGPSTCSKVSKRNEHQTNHLPG
ncbi:15007_t:CDS:2 [Cetraspora pellucida]|uniref:15007_t:CDS:1 n=1 Tax=Cetraspora pellucida TaxID=1433469 RepID=A0A9N9H016_9GLOM|nr:15007_t:CDS:2 [Cetraspora pellucida]